jgi:hypothetical protein
MVVLDKDPTDTSIPRGVTAAGARDP